METKLPILPLEKNVDEISLNYNSVALINGYVRKNIDGTYSFYKWYGDELSIDLELGNVGIDGSYYWREKSLQIVICNGRCFKIDSHKTITEITGTDISFVKGAIIEFTPLVVVSSEIAYLYMCDGQTIIYTDGNSLYQINSKAKFLAFINSYLLKIKGDGRFLERSDYDTPTTINATELYSLSDQSTIKAMAQGESGDILLVSDRSYEKYYNSGSDNVFEKIQGSYGNIGIRASKTLKYFNNSWRWLSNENEIMELQGSVLKVIECPYEKIFQEIEMDDAYAFFMKPFGEKYYVLICPTAKKTFVQNFKTNEWFELNDWLEIGDWDLWYGSCYSYNAVWKEHLIGSRTHSKLYKISQDKYTHDSKTVRSLIRFGNLFYGFAGKLKQVVKRTYTVLRGKVDMGDLTTEPKLLCRDRINGSSEIEPEREVKLGKIGDTIYQAFEYSNDLGTPFYQRQPEIVITDNVPLIIKEIEDEFNVEE